MDRWSETGRVSGQDYLISEVRSPARREYVGGIPYAVAVACVGHDRIAGNAMVALGRLLLGGPCPLPEIGCELPLIEVYRRIAFTAE